MRTPAIVLAATLILAPFDARAAEFVVWWEEGQAAEEDQAVREIIDAFKQKTGKEVELTLYSNAELPKKIVASLEAGRPPDFAFSYRLEDYIGQWAYEDRLVDLSDDIGHFSDLFDPDALSWDLWLNASTGQKALYGVPMGRTTVHVHVWKSLLERAGFALADVPKEWDAFWSFWCDQVQPAVREAIGRNDIWGIALPMSETAGETQAMFFQFLAAYQADYVTADGRLVIEDPEIRQGLIKAIHSYTSIYRQGCTPPDATSWSNVDNNKAFLAQTVLMTPNETLSIPNQLKEERPRDYYENTATIEWPVGPSGELFPIVGFVKSGLGFKGDNVDTVKAFVRFLVGEGWLMHYLNFSGERMLPPMSKLLEQPFWLDPADPHRMASVMQVSSRPMYHDYGQALGNRLHDRVWQEQSWAQAIHRIITEGISPEQAVDEAIARIKQILSE